MEIFAKVNAERRAKSSEICGKSIVSQNEMKFAHVT
jgi:hypothetical protein